MSLTLSFKGSPTAFHQIWQLTFDFQIRRFFHAFSSTLPGYNKHKCLNTTYIIRVGLTPCVYLNYFLLYAMAYGLAVITTLSSEEGLYTSCDPCISVSLSRALSFTSAHRQEYIFCYLSHTCELLVVFLLGHLSQT